MKSKNLLFLCILSAACSDIVHDSSTSHQDSDVRQIRDASMQIPTIDVNRDVAPPVVQRDLDASAQTNADVSSTDSDDVNPEQTTNFSQPGPYEVVEISNSASVTNCNNMRYTVYSPVGIDDPPVVVLGHGFGRGPSTMAGWAIHLASWGVEVLLPTLCHYNILTGVDHVMNGQNMHELADVHTDESVVYAGHSAGGLAAIIAASQDVDALGVLGLDATDTQDIPGVPDALGYVFATTVTCPAFSIMAEPSSCNANNNGLSLFRAMNDAKTVKITSTDHCDFENPTNFLCETNCLNEAEVFSDDVTRPIIVTLGTAAVISLSGISLQGDMIWSSLGLRAWAEEGIVQDIE